MPRMPAYVARRPSACGVKRAATRGHWSCDGGFAEPARRCGALAGRSRTANVPVWGWRRG
ncbi:hypothetical protein ACFPRL_17735 [Pseudoclavibacter helvolus]